MKTTLLILVAVVAVSYGREVSYILHLNKLGAARFHGYIEACYKETNTNEELIDKLDGKDLNKRPVDENCFFACYHHKIGAFNNGVYDHLEIVKDKFTEKNFETVVKCCDAYADEQNVCEKAFNAHMCYLANVTVT